MLKTIRWKIGLLMFIGVAINYLDRVNISHAIIVITNDFSLSNIEKGYVMSAFSFGYVLFMMLGGYLIFKFGPRISLFVSTIFLSITTIFCGFSTGFYSLLFSRFFIGVFEAPTFPGNAYIVSKWFPKNERGKATGFFDAGSYLGAAFAAPIIIFLIIKFNWRVCFIISGFIGIIWSLIWYSFFRDNPKQHLIIKKEELSALEELEIDKPKKIRWRYFLQNRKIIGISIGFFCYNYLKSFHLTWFPTYLVESKGLDFIKLSYAALIPPFFAIIGELFTGHLIDKLISKGVSPTYAKKIPICLGLILSSVIVFTLFTTNIFIVIFLITLSYMFLISASVGIWSIPDELAENKSSVAIIGSIQNTFSNIAGIIAPIATGYIYQNTNSFLIPFLISFCLAIIGAISYWYVVGELITLKFDTKI